MKITKTKRERSTSTTGHYVTNAVLLPAVKRAKALGKVTDELIMMIRQIAERYSRKGNFVGYSFREDMVDVAVVNLCNTALKFNTEKYDNPFSYYTQAIHNSFLQCLADEKKHRNIRDRLLVDAGSNPSFNFMESERDEAHFELKESDEIQPPAVEKPKDEDSEYPNDAYGAICSVVDQLIAGPEKATERPRGELTVRQRSRQSGAVTTYSADQVEIDPITFEVRVKPVAEVAPEKKPRKAPAKKTDVPVDSPKVVKKSKKTVEDVPLVKEQISIAKSLRTRPAEKRGAAKINPPEKSKKVVAKKAAPSKPTEKKVVKKVEKAPPKVAPKKKVTEKKPAKRVK